MCVSYEMKPGGDLELKFTTVSPPTRKEVTRIELVGMPYYARDKVLYSCGTQVLVYARNGKQLQQFQTNLTENVKNIAMEENFLWVAGVTSSSC